MVIDEVAGVIVMGENVRVSTVAIAQGNLTITVRESPAVSQPAPFSQGQTTVVPQSDVQVDEEKGKQFITVRDGASLSSLVVGPERPRRHAAGHDLHPADHQGRRAPASRHRGDVMDLSSSRRLRPPRRQGLDGRRRPADRRELAKRGKIAQDRQGVRGLFPLGDVQRDVQGCGRRSPFNGGEGEAAFKSFMNDAMAKQVVRSGGIGLADKVATEMLKLQGLS